MELLGGLIGWLVGIPFSTFTCCKLNSLGFGLRQGYFSLHNRVWKLCAVPHVAQKITVDTSPKR